MDSFSPFSAARVLVQVLPAGPIKPGVFNDTVKALRDAGPIQLGDISPPSDPDRNLFNPLSFPSGKISFHFTPSSKSVSHSILYPFETFREPFLVLGLADLSQLAPKDETGVEAALTVAKESLAELSAQTSQLRENYPNALVHKILLVGEPSDSAVHQIPDDISFLRPGSSPKTLLCDLAAQLLPELTGLSKSFQALQNYPSPLARDRNGQDDEKGFDSASRRGSLRPQPSSSSSLEDVKASHRMSMPAHLISSSSASAAGGSRPGTPNADGRSTPATTFDDIPGAIPPHVAARLSTPPITGTGSRDSSRDRAPAAGFGSGPLSDRNRLKQQARLTSITGSLYLQAGFWNIAARELSDSATKSRACGDYLWYSKALENLLISLLLLAWNGINFKIPDICYPSSTRPLASKGLQSTSSGSSGDVPASKPEDVAEAIRALYEIMPEVVHMIRDSYHRAWDTPGESLPHFAYSEMNVRFARLFIDLSDGGNLDGGMRPFVPSDPKLVLPKFSRGKALVRQASDMLQAAIPPPLDFADMSIMDTVTILGAIVSSYSALGMTRKSALVLQDFLDSLIPGLVQARKVGAAEAGLHPAAGIANLQSQVLPTQEGGHILENILKFFESVDLLPVRTDEGEEQPNRNYVPTSANKDTKVNLLRKCIKVCEALPDFNGVLRCTAELFALAGPGSAPNMRNPDIYILIPPEEQIMLSGNFYRMSDLIDNLQLPKSGGDYWDPFLVRGLEIEPPPPGREMISRRMKEFDNTATDQIASKTGPFLHNAFTKKGQAATSQAVFVAGESCTFTITLQNLFDFEVHIDSLELVTSIEDFLARREGLRLGPHCIQTFTISGTPFSAGKVRITGCKVAAKGCRVRVFDIVPGPWKPPDVIKIADGVRDGESKPISAAKETPKPLIAEATVLEFQPLLDVTNLSLSQNALEILEGERKFFKVTLSDHTSSSNVNFLRITPQDNVRLYLQSALKERGIRPSLRYEMEYQLFHDPNLRCSQGLGQQDIKRKEAAEFQFEVLGKLGLTHASIQFDYCYLADPTTKDSFFTRTVDVPFTIAVKPSIRLLSCHLAALPQDAMGVLAPRDKNCWMVLDFRNLSGASLKLSLKHHSDSVPVSEEAGPPTAFEAKRGVFSPRRLSRPPANHREGDMRRPVNDEQVQLIAPGRTSTISSVIPKAFIEKPHAAIPSLDPTKEHQFVLRTSGGAPVDERVERECFWFSNELIDTLSAVWADPDTGKSGTVMLRDISLAPDEVDVLKLDEIAISWDSELQGSLGVPSTAKFKLYNRTDEAIRVELQLYRTIAGFVDRVAGSNVETQLMSVIGPNCEAEGEFECIFESKGHHVFVPTVVEREAGDGAMDRPLRTWHGEPRCVTVK